MTLTEFGVRRLEVSLGVGNGNNTRVLTGAHPVSTRTSSSDRDIYF